MENDARRIGRFDDERFMRRALALARRALGRTSPNPMVGAVVVREGRVAGEGYHRYAGAAHAEVDALRRAGAQAQGATLYVTLEPCNHTGRTGPCCDAIVASGVRRVVIAANDPNPITDGRGIARLRRAGLSVEVGLLAREARRLNEPFEKVMRTGLPLVIAKVGQSLDGKIATAGGRSRWITSAASRHIAHRWRSRVDAVLVGVKTVLADDPLLTDRSRMSMPRRQNRPIKIIVDSRLRTPLAAQCLSARSPAPSLIATTHRSASARARALARRGADVLRLPARRGRVPLRRLCRLLTARRHIQSILIEGGGEVLAGALAERIVDRVVFFIAPVLLGGRLAPTSIAGAGINRLSQAVQLADVTYRRVGPDVCVEGRVIYPRRQASAVRGQTPSS